MLPVLFLRITANSRPACNIFAVILSRLGADRFKVLKLINFYFLFLEFSSMFVLGKPVKLFIQVVLPPVATLL